MEELNKESYKLSPYDKLQSMFASSELTKNSLDKINYLLEDEKKSLYLDYLNKIKNFFKPKKKNILNNKFYKRRK